MDKQQALKSVHAVLTPGHRGLARAVRLVRLARLLRQDIDSSPAQVRMARANQAMGKHVADQWSTTFVQATAKATEMPEWLIRRWVRWGRDIDPAALRKLDKLFEAGDLTLSGKGTLEALARMKCEEQAAHIEQHTVPGPQPEPEPVEHLFDGYLKLGEADQRELFRLIYEHRSSLRHQLAVAA